jgi:hypothetical protein
MDKTSSLDMTLPTQFGSETLHVILIFRARQLSLQQIEPYS